MGDGVGRGADNTTTVCSPREVIENRGWEKEGWRRTSLDVGYCACIQSSALLGVWSSCFIFKKLRVNKPEWREERAHAQFRMKP
ncbi:hypothetical protein AOLI_G00258510 [Acnodon oligacanthus]